MARDKLFNLVHSLSMGERKFFLQYARRHILKTETSYLQLFKAIARQTVYDEAALKEEFPFASFEKNFHKAKGYLYELVLKALVILKSENSAYGRALELLSKTEVLCERQLFKEALVQLNRLKEICAEYEFQELALAAIRWEEAILASVQLVNPDLRIIIADNYAQRKELLAEIDLAVEYRYLYFEWAKINAPFTPPSPEARSKLAEFINHALIQPENFPAARSTRRFYYGLNAMKARLMSDHEKAFHMSEEIIKIMESYPPGFYYTEMLLLYSYYSFVLDAVAAGKLATAKKYLSRLKQMNPGSLQIKHSHYHLLFGAELTVWQATDKRAECMDIIDQYESNLGNYKRVVSPLYEFRNYLLIINWLVKQKLYERSLAFVNRMLNEKTTERRLIIFQYQARLLNLAVHFELKNHELLEYLVRQTEYYFLKHPLSLHFPVILLRFFKKVTRPKSSLKKELKVLEEKLETIRHHPGERDMLNSFLQCGWLQNHAVLPN